MRGLSLEVSDTTPHADIAIHIRDCGILRHANMKVPARCPFYLYSNSEMHII